MVQLHLVLMPLGLIEINGVPRVTIWHNFWLGVVSN